MLSLLTQLVISHPLCQRAAGGRAGKEGVARGVQLLLGLAPAPQESPQPWLGVGQDMAQQGPCPRQGSLAGWGG